MAGARLQTREGLTSHLRPPDVSGIPTSLRLHRCASRRWRWWASMHARAGTWAGSTPTWAPCCVPCCTGGCGRHGVLRHQWLRHRGEHGACARDGGGGFQSPYIVPSASTAATPVPGDRASPAMSWRKPGSRTRNRTREVSLDKEKPQSPKLHRSHRESPHRSSTTKEDIATMKATVRSGSGCPAGDHGPGRT